MLRCELWRVKLKERSPVLIKHQLVGSTSEADVWIDRVSTEVHAGKHGAGKFDWNAFFTGANGTEFIQKYFLGPRRVPYPPADQDAKS